MSEYERGIIKYNLEKEKKDRIKESVIWYGFTILFTFLLLFSAYHHIEETLLKYKGNSFDVTYSSNSNVVSYKSLDGVIHTFKDVDTSSMHDGNIITMYYFGDDIDGAQTLNPLWFWLSMYAFWGILDAICIYKAYSGSRLTNHYKGERV